MKRPAQRLQPAHDFQLVYIIAAVSLAGSARVPFCMLEAVVMIEFAHEDGM